MTIKKTSFLLLIFLITLLLFLILSPDTSGRGIYMRSKDIKDLKKMDLKHVYKGFGCEGENKFPHLDIRNVPNSAKSLAITVYDPDAPTGSGWWHMIAYNIPVDVTEIESGNNNIADNVIFGRNDFGEYGYGGPCPPIKDVRHRYVFTVYALSVEKLDLPKDASAAFIGYNLNANKIEKGKITAIYERKK